jgi:uncharacterized protein
VSDCLFVSDLHGRPARVRALMAAIARRRPLAVFIGGDLFPSFGAEVDGADLRLSGSQTGRTDSLHSTDVDADRSFVDRLAHACVRLRDEMTAAYPRIFLILGNDDPRALEDSVRSAGAGDLWEYVHGRFIAWDGWRVFGYSCVPPTPFQLKDWERYDVSRYVDPGCVSPEEGTRTTTVDSHEIRFGTIEKDLMALAGDGPLDRTIWLFHAPPYRTALDRAALDGKFVEHVPLDVHVGSIAIRRFIERRQPAVTLHGHIHESARLTGRWADRIGRTAMLSAAHDGPELALVTVDPARAQCATRELISAESLG